MSTNKFRNTVKKVMNNPELYSKEDLQDLFLEMTERYLNEMVSCLNYERALINELGEEEGNQIIEQIATSNPSVSSLDSDNAAEPEVRERIENLLSYIECEFRSGL
ncbi:MAG: hypothetical protein IKE94_02845 [Aeriscardovia sp.]|nr:hypothetical protein [Aeriscardovia sp.]